MGAWLGARWADPVSPIPAGHQQRALGLPGAEEGYEEWLPTE